MIYNIIELHTGEKFKLDGKYTYRDIEDMCDLQGLELKSITRKGLINATETKEKELHYKVIWGFDEERSTDIEQDDLLKALYAMSTKSKVYLGDILLDGKYIIAIKENYQKYMGWNATYTMTSDDWNEIRYRGVDKLYAGKIYEAKAKVQELIASKDLTKLKSNQKQLN
jgi:hypothetical protein